MINKLRKKIFWIIQISLSIILIGLIVIFTGFSYKNTIESSTIFMDRLRGKESGPREFNEPNADVNPFIANIDGLYRVEIYNGKIINTSSDLSDEVKEYAEKIASKNQEEGYVGNYIYRTRKIGDSGKEITIMENKDAINRLKTTFIFSITIAITGIFIIYLIAKKISKTICIWCITWT